MPRNAHNPTALLAIVPLLALSACGEREDWSPLDGPWDPDHPEAAAVLAAPDPTDPIDDEMAEAGERWYRTRGCLACHRLEGDDALGPAMAGISERREYDWFRGMVMRPDSMLREDPIAGELLARYRVPMPDQGVDELRTRAIWEYLRGLDRERRDPTG
jgi:nitrite reductase (NO-forming)